LHTLTSTSLGQLPTDRSWFLHVNSFAQATPWLHAAFRSYAQYGIVLFAALLVWSWWIARGRRDLAVMAAALWVPAGMLIAVGLNQPLGNWIHRPRPYTTLQHVEVLVARTRDFSFPSDHAVMAGAVAAGVWLVSRRLGLLTTVAALLMGFTRVYVGAHYPGDVILGLLFGAVVTLLGYVALRPVLRLVVTRLARTPVRVLLTSSHATPNTAPHEGTQRGPQEGTHR
jgi:undecaprenyl-diphosphatase